MSNAPQRVQSVQEGFWRAVVIAAAVGAVLVAILYAVGQAIDASMQATFGDDTQDIGVAVAIGEGLIIPLVGGAGAWLLARFTRRAAVIYTTIACAVFVFLSFSAITAAETQVRS